jgi:hypothetical protein
VFGDAFERIQGSGCKALGRSLFDDLGALVVCDVFVFYSESAPKGHATVGRELAKKFLQILAGHLALRAFHKVLISQELLEQALLCRAQGNKEGLGFCQEVPYGGFVDA